MPNLACQAIVNKYSNNTLKKVVNVYQVQFKDFKAPGLGDYLRGCFCMSQILNTLNEYCNTNVVFDMDIRNHPMAQYIQCDPPDTTIPYSTIGNFHIDSLKVKKDESDIAFQHILREIVRYMDALDMETFYTFCCRFEIYDEIKEVDKEFMRSKLKPTEAMQAYINESLNKLNIQPKGYSVLHIRCTDELSFPPSELQKSLVELIEQKVAESIHPDKKYLIITNNKEIKEHFIKINPNIFGLLETEMCHVGQDPNQTSTQVRDTMLDFFLIANAKDVVAFSPYDHGTGFSMECCKLYNVPYTGIHVEERKSNEPVDYLKIIREALAKEALAKKASP